MTNPEKAYVDTNILISYALGEKAENFHQAKKVFDDVINGKYRMVVSNFVLAEALHALRCITARSMLKELRNNLSQSKLIEIANSKEFNREIHERSWKAFREIIECVTADPEHFQCETPETNYSGKIFSEGLRILATNFGECRVFRYRCTRCDSYMKCGSCGYNSEIVYKEINAPDITHIFISATLGCKYFFTMDKYFSKIPEERLPVKLEILSR